eukprot:8479856-Pyramimonas_sp.AAC.1
MDFENPPDPSKRKLPLDEYTQASKILTDLHAHARATLATPNQANMSQTFALDKRKAIPGPPGLRLLH